MATPTYTLIDSTVLGTSAASVTFSGIAADWRDLVLVYELYPASGSGVTTISINFNSDTGSNYNNVAMAGTGSSALSASASGATALFLTYQATPEEPSGSAALGLVSIMDYSATDKHKTVLSRNSVAADGVNAVAGRWASTSAITSFTLNAAAGDSFAAGGTVYIYGIEA